MVWKGANARRPDLSHATGASVNAERRFGRTPGGAGGECRGRQDPPRHRDPCCTGPRLLAALILTPPTPLTFTARGRMLRGRRVRTRATWGGGPAQEILLDVSGMRLGPVPSGITCITQDG